MAKHYPKLSEMLKKLLFERSMKPIQLARELNLPQPTVHRLVTGKSTRPYKSSLVPIAEFFGITTDQLLGETPLSNLKNNTAAISSTNKKIKAIPLISWKSLNEKKDKIIEDELIIAGNISEKAFALITPDYSMEPLFQKGSILIFDPAVKISDRSYALVKLKDSNTHVFRQLLIDLDHRYIKSLHPDISATSMRLLKTEDEIIACLIETRNNFQPQK